MSHDHDNPWRRKMILQNTIHSNNMKVYTPNPSKFHMYHAINPFTVMKITTETSCHMRCNTDYCFVTFWHAIWKLLNSESTFLKHQSFAHSIHRLCARLFCKLPCVNIHLYLWNMVLFFIICTIHQQNRMYDCLIFMCSPLLFSWCLSP